MESTYFTLSDKLNWKTIIMIEIEIKLNMPKLLEIITDNATILTEAAVQDELVNEKPLKNISLSNQDLSRINFQEVIFENCKFINCNLEKTSFVNVMLETCDFSNFNLEDSYLSNCKIISSKFLGANLPNSAFKQVAIED